MTCQIGQKLQAAWYATAPIVSDPSDIPPVTPDYQDKMLAYKNHRATCPTCREEMRQPDQPARATE